MNKMIKRFFILFSVFVIFNFNCNFLNKSIQIYYQYFVIIYVKKLQFNRQKRNTIVKTNKIQFFNISLKLSDQIFFLKQIFKGKSFMRATHNLFLKKNINLTQPIANIGSGKKSEYTKYICKDDFLVKNYDFFKYNICLTEIISLLHQIQYLPKTKSLQM